MKNSNPSTKKQAPPFWVDPYEYHPIGPIHETGCQKPAQPDSVTCLFSNNSIEAIEQLTGKIKNSSEFPGLSPYQKKQAETLYLNVERLVSLAPSPDHVAMLTLTFVDNVKDYKEAQRRWNSFRTNYLAKSKDFTHWLLVKEKQKRGAWHYHIIVICSGNVREYFDAAKYKRWLEQRNQGKKRRLNTGNKYLRELWERNRYACKKYGFGIPHMIPMMSNKQAMARYVGKYVSKHMGKRKPEDKGVRLVHTSQGWSKNSVRFAWYTPNSQEWRRKTALFAKHSGCNDLFELAKKWGSTWAYTCMDMIYRIDEVEAAHQEEQANLAWIRENVPF